MMLCTVAVGCAHGWFIVATKALLDVRTCACRCVSGARTLSYLILTLAGMDWNWFENMVFELKLKLICSNHGIWDGPPLDRSFRTDICQHVTCIAPTKALRGTAPCVLQPPKVRIQRLFGRQFFSVIGPMPMLVKVERVDYQCWIKIKFWAFPHFS